jgi:hypothetical protein
MSWAERTVAWLGLGVGIAMTLMKLLPVVPGHFTVYEWLALFVWIAIGAVIHRRGGSQLQS